MPEEKSVVYDPDPVDMQVQLFSKIGVDGIQLSDLSRPETVTLLVHFQKLAVAQIKAANKEIEELKAERSVLESERQKLSVANARLEAGSAHSWIEVPVGIIAGFAINMLTVDPTSAPGWAMLVLTSIILVFMRLGDLAKVVESVTKSVRGKGISDDGRS